MSEPAPLVLVEPGPAAEAGHWYQPVLRLCGEAARHGHPVVLVVPGGITHTARQSMQHVGARVIDTPAGAGLAAGLLWTAGVATRRAAAVALRLARHRRFPHQLTLAGRCLAEAAALRIARAHCHPDPVAVVLSASDGLHTAAAALSGTAHLRVVHEVYTTEDRPARWAGRLAMAFSDLVLVVAPTEAVRASLVARFPRIRTVCRPFAMADAEERLRDGERGAARAGFRLQPADIAVALVGGWWPHKDITTVAEALRLVTAPVHVLVAGHPVDRVLLEGMATTPGVRVHARIGDLPRERIRQVYAAADAAIVARRPGVGKESGLIADTAVLGVPLIVSGHDPATTATLAGRPWVRVFPAGDPAGLAVAIDELAARRLQRPTPDQATALGLRTATAVLADYLDLHHTLITTKARR